jgi:hypothetical protein
MNIKIENLGMDEKCILQFLKHWRYSFVSGTEIARRADGKARLVDDPRWAGLALFQLVELHLVEHDGHDKYRVKERPTVKCAGKRRFIAPHLQDILKNTV